MAFRDGLYGWDIEARQQRPQGLSLRRNSRRAEDGTGGIARIEQNRAAVLHVFIDLAERFTRQLRRVGGQRPVDQRKEYDFVPIYIDAHGVSRLNGGALLEHGG